MTAFSFNITATSGKARTGIITTAHGEIRTPAFMPVGTAASVKAMMPWDVRATGADIILGNTYHLMLRPGEERVERLGGLRKFMGWDGPILTDSGGFQVMSLSSLRKMSEEGVEFSSHIDGSKHMLSPERSMQVQHKLGATITMAFDECTPYPATYDEAAESMALSMRWARRSKDAFIERDGYALFGIMQGGVHGQLRRESTEILQDIGFDGMAIGGLAVGEGQDVMFDVLDASVPHTDPQKPRYLMGVGKPDDIVGAVMRGVDMFDCVLPTRSGRNGQAFVRKSDDVPSGVINIRNARYAEDTAPLDEQCSCPACTHYTRAYLHHLVKAGEIQGAMLMTWHNLQYYQDLMSHLRDIIKSGEKI